MRLLRTVVFTVTALVGLMLPKQPGTDGSTKAIPITDGATDAGTSGGTFPWGGLVPDGLTSADPEPDVSTGVSPTTLPESLPTTSISVTPDPLALALDGFVASSGRSDLIDQATCIVMAESGGNPLAVSSTDDHGMFQINRPTWQRFFGYPDFYDPWTNGYLAGVIFNRAGQRWTPWTVYPRCVGT